jgi:hypothetical protein
MTEDQNQLQPSLKEARRDHFPEDRHAPKPPLISNQQPTAKMEVHHPHHPSHKKKWSEYLLEFAMLSSPCFWVL